MHLAHRQPDGAPLRAHLQAAARQTRRPDPRLAADVPRAGAALWSAFVSLSASRAPAFSGISPLLPSEMLAWQALHGLRLTGWEIDTLTAMDSAACAAQAALAPAAAKG